MAGNREEGPVIGFIMNLFASVVFSVPTALLLWFGLNRDWALENPDATAGGLYLTGSGFWILLGALVFVGVCFPRLFPGLMGYCWRKIIRLGRWVTHW
ncbi:hypothetical protein [Aliamphritea spongicola]|uniref:hypothetical protein n=1 Tax=Aliamphritea spongicola TaxID=707589 RepID=UPI00196A1FC8|nr:hypothetical protein [Aliamphritea spongicola]MBN3564300.1 hypothetical protein [Aliamphritea spongicola]